MIQLARSRSSARTTNAHLGRAAFAGFTGGYLMALTGYWIEAVAGISDVVFEHSELQFASGNRPGWWVIGIIFHFIDSVLLGLLYAVVVQPKVSQPASKLGSPLGSVASGLGFGVLVWSTLAMLISMPFAGAGAFGWRTGSARPAIASLILHLVFGFFLGIVYGDPRQRA